MAVSAAGMVEDGVVKIGGAGAILRLALVTFADWGIGEGNLANPSSSRL